MSHSSPPPLSGGRGFYKEREGNRTKRSRERLKSSLFEDQHSLKRQVTVQCAWSWFSHPGFTSFWLHGWRSANLPELGCLKIRIYIFSSYSLEFLYKHAVHLQATYSSESTLTETMSEERWGGLQFPNDTIFSSVTWLDTHNAPSTNWSTIHELYHLTPQQPCGVGTFWPCFSRWRNWDTQKPCDLSKVTDTRQQCW